MLLWRSCHYALYNFSIYYINHTYYAYNYFPFIKCRTKAVKITVKVEKQVNRSTLRWFQNSLLCFCDQIWLKSCPLSKKEPCFNRPDADKCTVQHGSGNPSLRSRPVKLTTQKNSHTCNTIRWHCQELYRLVKRNR